MAPEFWKRRQVSWVLPTIISAMDGFALKVRYRSSLCNLCVLCVSVVDEFRAKTHHRDTENTEVAQRISEVITSLLGNQWRCHRPDLYWTKAKVDRLNDVNSALRDRRFEHRYPG